MTCSPFSLYSNSTVSTLHSAVFEEGEPTIMDYMLNKKMLVSLFLMPISDIAFRLAQMNALSKRLKEATTRRYFRVEFKVSKLGRSRRISIFLVRRLTVYVMCDIICEWVWY